VGDRRRDLAGLPEIGTGAIGSIAGADGIASPPRRRGPLSVYAASPGQVASGPRLREGDDHAACRASFPKPLDNCSAPLSRAPVLTQSPLIDSLLSGRIRARPFSRST